MTSPGRLLTVLSLGSMLAGCGSRGVDDGVGPGGAEVEIPVGGLILQQPATPAQVADLIEGSPCDILPESANVVGLLAHDDGYPRWTAGVMVFDTMDPRLTPDPLVVQALTGGPTFENEVHDCQRLVVADSAELSFGPLVGLLPLDPSMSMADAAFSGGRVIATVYNWGDFQGGALEYDPLAIGDGWSCLWLKRVSADKWSAAITPHSTASCLTRANPPDSVYTLDVLRLHHSSGTIPKTGRFGWHAASNVHLMGVKCGSAWCWVGPTDLWAEDRVDTTGSPATTIPGYFDEQHLAIPFGLDSIIPGPYARVAPTDSFYSKAIEQGNAPHDVLGPLFLQGWRVARIEMPEGIEAPQTYIAKWGSAATPILLELQTGPNSERSRFFHAAGPALREVAPARIHNAAHAAVGALRWRWHDTSATESIWSACGVRGMDCCDTN